jgi:hypothetical protein
MTDPADWAAAGWEGHRRAQHREFQALPLREKLAIIEQLSETVAYFTEKRRARGLPVRIDLAGEPG